jgi:hypothetical protein
MGRRERSKTGAKKEEFGNARTQKTKRTQFQGRRSILLRVNLHRPRRILNFDFCSLIFDMILTKRTHFFVNPTLQGLNLRIFQLQIKN